VVGLKEIGKQVHVSFTYSVCVNFWEFYLKNEKSYFAYG